MAVGVACRGTNKAITVPATNNKLVVDTLPEAEFSGVVRGTVGTLAGGIVAFAENPAAGPDDPPLVVQLRAAGAVDGRKEECDQVRDDRDHDEALDQGEDTTAR